MEDIIYPLKGLLETLGWWAAFVLVAWFYYRYKLRENEQRQQLLMKALERGENTEELVRSLQKPRKSHRDRQLSRLFWGWGLTIVGAIMVLAPIGYGLIQGDWDTMFEEVGPLVIIGAFPLGIGLGFLMAYREGKRTMKDDD